MLGGKACRLHLKRQPHFDEIEQSFRIIADDRSEKIGKGGAIGLAHDSLAASRNRKQAAAFQALDRLAYGQPADIIARGQFGLAGQHGAGREFAQNHLRQMLGDNAGSRLLASGGDTLGHDVLLKRYQIPWRQLACFSFFSRGAAAP
jgi:hypothetical protein